MKRPSGSIRLSRRIQSRFINSTIDPKKETIPAGPAYPGRRQVARFVSENSSAWSATYLASMGAGTGMGMMASSSPVRFTLLLMLWKSFAGGHSFDTAPLSYRARSTQSRNI